MMQSLALRADRSDSSTLESKPGGVGDRARKWGRVLSPDQLLRWAPTSRWVTRSGSLSLPPEGAPSSHSGSRSKPAPTRDLV